MLSQRYWFRIWNPTIYILSTKVQESPLQTTHCKRSVVKNQTVEVFMPQEFEGGSLPVTEVFIWNEHTWNWLDFLCANAILILWGKNSFKYAIIDMKHTKPDQTTHILTTTQQIDNIQKLRETSRPKAIGPLSFSLSHSPGSLIPLPPYMITGLLNPLSSLPDWCPFITQGLPLPGSLPQYPATPLWLNREVLLSDIISELTV